MQRPEGDSSSLFSLYSACTYAEAVYLLEQAKMSILVGDGDADGK